MPKYAFIGNLVNLLLIPKLAPNQRRLPKSSPSRLVWEAKVTSAGSKLGTGETKLRRRRQPREEAGGNRYGGGEGRGRRRRRRQLGEEKAEVGRAWWQLVISRGWRHLGTRCSILVTQGKELAMSVTKQSPDQLQAASWLGISAPGCEPNTPYIHELSFKERTKRGSNININGNNHVSTGSTTMEQGCHIGCAHRWWLNMMT